MIRKYIDGKGHKELGCIRFHRDRTKIYWIKTKGMKKAIELA
jgi:hypothetical protein